MTIENPVYYNAALAGFLAGALALSPSGATNAGLVTAAQAYAAAVDAAVYLAQGSAVDPKVTASATTTITTPATAVETNAIGTRPAALRSFCQAQIQGYTTDPTQADYAPLATAVATTFLAYIAASVTT
jgi:hypothetical protein